MENWLETEVAHLSLTEQSFTDIFSILLLVPIESHVKGHLCSERVTVPSLRRGVRCFEKQRLLKFI